MNKNNRGFTLIELMVTVAIIIILATMAIPSFTSTINERRLDHSLRELSLTFVNARNQALTIKRNVEVKLNSKGDNTVTVLNWMPQNKVALESGSSLNVIFEPSGAIQNFNDNKMIFSLCSSDLKKSKKLQLNIMGSLTVLADGSCS